MQRYPIYHWFLMMLGFGCSATTSADAQTMSIEDYERRSTLVVPAHPVTRARYPVVDVHKWFITYHDRVLFGKDAWNPDEYHVTFGRSRPGTSPSTITETGMPFGSWTGSIRPMVYSENSITATRFASSRGSTRVCFLRRGI